MTQQWDFAVDEPVSLPAWRQHRLSEHLPAIAARLQRGETLRSITLEYGLSHEALRQALRRRGHVTRPSPMLTAAPRRLRVHRLSGRGRSTTLAPEELGALLIRHHAGESMRSLARSVGVSHETVRRALAGGLQTGTAIATA